MSMLMEHQVYVGKSTIEGRGLFALVDKRAGETIQFLTRPMAAALNISALDRICSNCFGVAKHPNEHIMANPVDSLLVCKGCKVNRFCSKQCQKEAWKRNHKAECKNIGAVSKYRHLPHIIRLTVMVLQRRLFGDLPEDEWDEFMLLKSDLDKLKHNVKPTWQELELMARGAWTFAMAEHWYTLEDVYEIFGKILMNSFTLVSSTHESLGIAVDPLISVANHSCDPNCIIMGDGPNIYLRTLKPVKKGEEVTISYCVNHRPYWKRQKDLKAKYFFDCRCSMCTQGPTLLWDKFAQPLEAFETEKWRKVLEDDFGITELISNKYKEIGEGPAADVLTTLEVALFEQNAVIEKAKETGHVHECAVRAMKICKESKMWPVYREPYEMYRQSDLNARIGMEDLVTAIAHAVVAYCDIYPALYPERSHPLRLIGTWTLLCLLNSITPDEMITIMSFNAAKGLDLGTVSYTLSNEVLENIEKSHGNVSSFYKLATDYARERLERLRKVNPFMFGAAAESSEKQMKLLRRLGEYAEY